MSAIQIVRLLIFLPALLALLTFLLPRKAAGLKSLVALIATGINLIFAIRVFSAVASSGESIMQIWPWGGMGIDFSIRLDYFSSFIILAAAVFCFLVTFYTIAFVRKRHNSGLLYVYFLLTMVMVNGAVMANNLVMLLFFWEGLLIMVFGMIMLGGRDKFPTAVKALVLGGSADLLLMLGLAITAWVGGSLTITGITPIPVEGIAILGFVCMSLGAVGKAGAMPFHSWIPDAANAAPLPFMALLPAALEKLLGIYLLARIVLELYALEAGSGMSHFLMILGICIIVFAVSMAIIQKDYKRMLAYHAVSQVGYMILGIGTALPVGIVGGLFHMLNHALYKSCLFLTAGSVERQTGTTDMRELGGLRHYMPITTLCFVVAAASISGVPPFNGFFSKELVFDAAIESGLIYYIAAVLGAFLTMVSFLKLGHSVFFSKIPEGFKKVREAPGAILLPMLVLAAICVLFGVYNPLPLQGLIQPSIGEALAGQDFSGLPHSWTLVIISIIVLLLALVDHIYGYRKSGSAVKAADHIRALPGLNFIYNKAEARYFDPYDILIFVFKGFAHIAYAVDRATDWVYNVLFVKTYQGAAAALSKVNQGNHAHYLGWALSGFVVVVCIVLYYSM